MQANMELPIVGVFNIDRVYYSREVKCLRASMSDPDTLIPSTMEYNES